jgi:hypothetical protein
MNFRLSASALISILFTAVLLKCLSPFLHAHVAGSSESGFHVAGMTSPIELSVIQDQSGNTNSESYAVTVSDSRSNTFAILILPVTFFAALHMMRRIDLVMRLVSREPRFVSKYLNPNFPPPALAPPL